MSGILPASIQLKQRKLSIPASARIFPWYERRRTEIARSLSTEPKFLLLDEPFAGIDPIAVFEINQIIRRLADKGIGILITDHNVRDTLEITTEAFIINEGTIVARGNKDEILSNEMVREIYLGSEFRM